MATDRRLHLGLNVPPLGSSPQAWRRAGIDPLSPITGEFYARVAVAAEAAHFDAFFINDQPTLNPGWESSSSPFTLDPSIALATAAQHTSRIGLVPTLSTTWHHPYNLARTIGSLDRVSHGRAGWNVVTTYIPRIAANYGAAELPSKADRYARASEFIDVVLDLWQTWAPDAIVADKQTGLYARSDGLRLVEHSGPYFTVRGGGTMPPSEQGRPVIFQAGGSSEGIAMAAKYADATFLSTPTIGTAHAYRAKIAQASAQRTPGRPRLLMMAGAVLALAGTDEEAARRRFEIEGSDADAKGLAYISARLGLPLEALDLDAPIPLELVDLDARRREDSEGAVNSVVEVAKTGQPLREILRGSVGLLSVVGSPATVADLFEEWFSTDAIDGFNISFDVVEEGLEIFVAEVVPLLQKRGLFRREYGGTTLRSHLGLPVPG